MPRQNLLFFRSKDERQNPGDQELVRICLATEDHQAFEQIVERYRNRVFGVAYHLVLDYEDARDVSQQSFLKLWKSLSLYDFERSFSGWVCRITANCAVDFLRTRKIQEPLPEMIQTPSTERDLDIRRIFERVAPLLPERQRVALVLREMQGMEIQEISEVMECTESTVRNLISQARESFRKRVRQLFPHYGL